MNISCTTPTLLTHTTAALVTFAQTHQQFAQDFARLITDNLSLATSHTTLLSGSAYLIPPDNDTAYAQAHWLIHQLKHNPDPHLTGTLTAWAREHSEPQAAVLGIVGIAIIGPTLGLIKKKKKRKSQMRVVFRDDVVNRGSVSHIHALGMTASLGLLSHELETVGGDAQRLDPELSDWLFADRDTRLFTLSSTELSALKATLTTEQLPHYAVGTPEHLIAIALHPMINDDLACGTGLDE